MLLTNALMLNYFVKSLNRLSTLTATITSAGTNFLCTAVLGRFCFHEDLSIQWGIGASFILIGMQLIIRATPVKQKVT